MPSFAPQSAQEASDQQRLLNALMSPEIRDDPEAFVMFVFPWGQANTPLAGKSGPRAWQRRALRKMRDHIHYCRTHGVDEWPGVLKIARVAGRGVGKTAWFAWCMWWMISTRPGSSVVFTANTQDQMKDVIWAEFGKWHALALNGHWFERMSLKLSPCPWYAELLKRDLGVDIGYHYILGKTWSEETPGAFVGLHNPAGMMLLFEEAADIPPCIWDVSEGFFTEKDCPDRYWLTISNGRRNSGTFFECFHRWRDEWDGEHISGLDVEEADQKVYQKIIDKYGMDSDEARIEVLGQFPQKGEKSLMSRAVIRAAMEREVVPDMGAALVMACDISRSDNGDSNVVAFRRGNDCRSIPHEAWKSADSVYTAHKIAGMIDEHQPDVVAIDEGGVGGPVIDILRRMGYKIIGLKFGERDPSGRYLNKRTQMWVDFADRLGVLCLPEDQRLEDDLAGPKLDYHNKYSDKLALETKEDMRRRGLASPDYGDAYVMTCAVRAPRHDMAVSKKHKRKTSRSTSGVSYMCG